MDTRWAQYFIQLEKSGKPFVQATIIDVKGSAPRDIGTRLFVKEDGTFLGTIGGGKLEDLVLEEARHLIKDKTPFIKKVSYPLCIRAGQCCGGAVEVMFELIHSQADLYIFGAGHVGQAVCQVLQNTPFKIHLIDEREEWIHHPHLPETVIKHSQPLKEFLSQAQWDEKKTYAVVMTYLHDLDLEIVGALARKPLHYLGLIGSQTKWQRFQQRLKSSGLSEPEIAKITCPIGLPTGGKAPQEVAISLAAQLLQLYYQDLK